MIIAFFHMPILWKQRKYYNITNDNSNDHLRCIDAECGLPPTTTLSKNGGPANMLGETVATQKA